MAAYFRFWSMAVCAVLLLQAPCFADVLIDDFSGPDFTNAAFATMGNLTPSIVFNDNALSPSNTIGGSRSGSVQFISGAAAGDAFTLSYGDGLGGTFNIGTLSGTANTALAIVYNATGAGLSANLSGEAGIRFEINIVDAAAIGTTITVTLTDGDGDVATSMVTLTSVGSQEVNMPFSGFSNLANLNLGDIDSIAISGNIPPAGDISIDNILAYSSTVPEPASMLAWGTVIGLGWVVSRRNRLLARRKSS